MNLTIQKTETKQHHNLLLPAQAVIKTLSNERLLTIKEVAALTGYNGDYIRSLALKGTLRSYKVGIRRLITIEDAVQFGSKTKRTESRKNLPLLINIKGRLISERG